MQRRGFGRRARFRRKRQREWKLNRYNITGIVTNVGSASQGTDALQSVDVYQGKTKLDSKIIPPLKAAQSLRFLTFPRARPTPETGQHQLRFQLNVRHPSPSDSQICNMANDSFTLTF